MTTKSTSPDTPRRRMRGFERADGLLSKRIAQASEGRGFAVARLLTHWDEVAGPELGSKTRPVNISYARAGMGATLTILTKGSEAPFIQAELPKLKERVNACYGYAAVARIAITQTAPVGFAEGQVDFNHKPKVQRASAPDEKAVARASEVARDVADPELRLALSRMGAHILQNTSDEEKV